MQCEFSVENISITISAVWIFRGKYFHNNNCCSEFLVKTATDALSWTEPILCVTIRQSHELHFQTIKVTLFWFKKLLDYYHGWFQLQWPTIQHHKSLITALQKSIKIYYKGSIVFRLSTTTLFIKRLHIPLLLIFKQFY